ncbi:MAG: 6-phosphogluconolactonase, cycloisomerase 2 family [Candidatus Angelobacter sp.]|nr:6-phosphogluconolactonase, cycloisomerase 2 family [Candidatus Angelobacter sp.]
MRYRNSQSFWKFSFALLLVALTGCNGFFTPRTDPPAPTTPKFAFVANFQNATAGSISIFSINSTTGLLTTVGSAVSTASNGPAALVIVGGKFLYSANDAGTVSAFTVNSSTGALTTISGSSFNTGGSNPNAIVADTSGKFLYVANSGSDDITAFSIDATTGSLTVIGSPVVTTSSGTAAPPVGLATHPNGKFLYAALDSAGVSVFSINATTGALTFVNTVPAQSGTHPQSITVEKTGKFAYVVDGVSAIDEYSIDSTTGNLTLLASPNSTVAAGTVPIVITADSTGSHVYVASQSSNNVFSFGILTTGALSPIGTAVATGASPSAVAIESSGKFVYVTNFSGSPDISIYSIDSTGKLVSAGTAGSGVSPANAASIAFL